jgi:hypothetical protein
MCSQSVTLQTIIPVLRLCVGRYATALESRKQLLVGSNMIRTNIEFERQNNGEIKLRLEFELQPKCILYLGQSLFRVFWISHGGRPIHHSHPASAQHQQLSVPTRKAKDKKSQ